MQTTKFKVGDEVWDSVHYPKQKGIVDEIGICEYYDYQIIVNFEEDFYTYTLDGSLYPYSKATLSFTPYEVEFEGFTQERPKVLTDEMKVCIKGDGTLEYGAKIMEYLVKLGGEDTGELSCNSSHYYYINQYFIDGKDTIPEGYKEINLKEDAIKQVYYVGKKIEYNGSIFLILQQDKESVDILLDGKQEVIMIDDITNGKYRIIE
jgi:hypothetical protein